MSEGVFIEVEKRRHPIGRAEQSRGDSELGSSASASDSDAV